MDLTYKTYEYTPVLGWSISRYELFDKCRRQYFYEYYQKFVKDVPLYKMRQLREVTTVALEVGNVVHDVLEAFLRRLQKSDADIDEQRFYDYADRQTAEYFAAKTFLEVLTGKMKSVDLERARTRVHECLGNFIGSPVYSWIFMKALRNRDNWMIEPPGYGETRLGGLKAYCKMDFLFPVDGDVAIIDWKTGKRDEYKHRAQVMGYAAAANSNFDIPVERIFPRIVYLYPRYDELEVRLGKSDFDAFTATIREQTEAMYALCENSERNIPRPIEHFPVSPSASVCAWCKYQQLCFPNGLPDAAGAEF